MNGLSAAEKDKDYSCKSIQAVLDSVANHVRAYCIVWLYDHQQTWRTGTPPFRIRKDNRTVFSFASQGNPYDGNRDDRLLDRCRSSNDRASHRIGSWSWLSLRTTGYDSNRVPRCFPSTHSRTTVKCGRADHKFNALKQTHLCNTRYAIGLTVCLITAFVAGCASHPHNNVLIFGTETKLALDVSTDATQGGAPGFTLGYKRREAVWLPLTRNDLSCTHDEDCSVATDTSSNALYRGHTEEQSKTPEAGKVSKDAYSVFASFGADLNQSGSSSDADGFGLAQFFATGIAAQRLSANQRVAEALAVQPASTSDLNAMREEIAATNSEFEQLIRELGTIKLAEIQAEAAMDSDSANQEIDMILNCALPDNPPGKKAELIGAAVSLVTDATVIEDLNGLSDKNGAQWRASLQKGNEMRNALLSSIDQVCGEQDT